MNRALQLLMRWTIRPNWVLADQVIVSGCKFAASVLVARFLGPAMFGVFVLMQIAQLYANGCQGALVISPMLVGAPRLEGEEQKSYLSGMFALQIILSGLLVVVIAALGLAVHLIAPKLDRELINPTSLMAMTLALVAFQFQDWQRRCFFVNGSSRGAFLIDLINYLPQLLAVAIAGRIGVLSVNLTFLIMAITSSLSFFAGNLTNRVKPGFHQGLVALRREWRACRDYLLSWQIMWAGTQGTLLIGTAFLGQQALGGIRATQNLMGPFTALFQALDNVVPVNAAKRYSKFGMDGVVTYMRSVIVRGSVILVPIIALIVLFGEPLTRILYGERYLAYATLIVWQALYILSQFYVNQFYYFFRVVSATRAIFLSCCVVAIVSTTMTFLLARHYQATGVVAANLCGTLAGFTCAAFLTASILRRRNSTSLVPAVTEAT